MRYVNEKSVKECYHVCPLFTTSGNEMSCGHQHFKDGGLENRIITQDNSRGRVPDQCPLKRFGPTEIVLRLKLFTDEYYFVDEKDDIETVFTNEEKRDFIN